MITAEQQQTTFLGPARVGKSHGKRVQLVFPDQKVWAVMALAYPYEPAVNDSVLAISQNDDWYVIGVLDGKGQTSFTAPGDMQFRAPNGSIEFRSGKEFRIHSPLVKVAADQLEMVAQTFRETFENATRWIRGTLRVRAGRLRTKVDADCRLNAKSIVNRAEDHVKIDGKKIHLG